LRRGRYGAHKKKGCSTKEKRRPIEKINGEGRTKRFFVPRGCLKAKRLRSRYLGKRKNKEIALWENPIWAKGERQ